LSRGGGGGGDVSSAIGKKLQRGTAKRKVGECDEVGDSADLLHSGKETDSQGSRLVQEKHRELGPKKGGERRRFPESLTAQWWPLWGAKTGQRNKKKMSRQGTESNCPLGERKKKKVVRIFSSAGVKGGKRVQERVTPEKRILRFNRVDRLSMDGQTGEK